MLARNCPDCGSSLGKSAWKCRCGWKSAPQLEARPMIACYVLNCLEAALCHVLTAQGTVNVCRSHYAGVEKVYCVTRNPFMDACRAAYANSYAFRQKNKIKGHVSESLPEMREPGSDDE